MRRVLRAQSRIVLGAAVALLIVASGCGDDDPNHLATSAAKPAYLAPGPYPVALTTYELADRKVAVFYPAVPGSEAGKPHAMYRQTDPLQDPLLRSITESLARRRGINLAYEMRAFGELPAASGRFPVLLFSHGFGGWRLVNSGLLSGIASWGFVIASAEHLERDLDAVATMTVRADVNKDHAVILESLQLLKTENAKAGGLLEGRIDAEHVAVAGHSAGGAAALTFMDDPQVDTIIGYAAVGAVSNPPSKPIMLITAAGDIGVTRATTSVIFNALQAPKSYVEIAQVGHNTFTDLCDAIRAGATLTQLAADAGIQISPQLLALAQNGCSAADLDPSECWAITQHLTVAHLRHVFGIDRKPVDLGPAVGHDFVVPLDYMEVL